MHLVSWNLNGIKGAKDALRSYLLERKPDVLCINELKLSRPSLEKVKVDVMAGEVGEIYDVVWNPCHRGAWHGTAVLAKKELRMEVLALTLDPKAKRGSTSPWLDKSSKWHEASTHIREECSDVDPAEISKAHEREGRLCTVKLHPSKEEDPIILVATYVPNSGVNFRDPLRRLAYRVHHWDADLYATLLELAATYRGRVIWAGDLNVIHKPEDVAYFKRRIGCAGATNDEMASFDGFLASTPFVDAWRHFHPEEVAYSFYNAKYPRAGATPDGWRLDYFIVHENLLGQVTGASIDLKDDHDFAVKVGGCGPKSAMRVSDHLPISLVLKDT